MQAGSFSCRSFSLQSYYQNLLADYQAGVGIRALSSSQSAAFLGGCSGLCLWHAASRECLWSHIGSQMLSEGRAGYSYLSWLIPEQTFLTFPSTLPERWFTSAGFKLCCSRRPVSSNRNMQGDPMYKQQQERGGGGGSCLKQRLGNHSLCAPPSRPSSPESLQSGSDGGPPHPSRGP